MKKKWAIGGLLVFVAVILVPIMINALYLINGGYITVWQFPGSLMCFLLSHLGY